MSLKHAANTHSDHTSRISGINEMQREDFLALAAALRQFNGYEPLVSLSIVNAQQGAEGYARQASE